MNEVVVNTYLAGVRRFIASVRAEAAVIGELRTAVTAAGTAMGRTNRQSFLWRQTLFTLRRVIYSGTLVTLGAAAAAIKMGNDYNSAMQTARIALRGFIPSNVELNNVLDRLWNIAKFTPFQIKDMTLSFRNLYPAMKSTGITSDELVTTIKNLIDALSVAGNTTPAALNRVTYALQHMAFQGRLTGRTVQQLAAVGIPIFDILHQKLGLSADDLHHIADLGIPAADVLRAINQYITTTPGFINKAQMLATQSVEGLWSTFKDNVSQTMGLAEKQGFGSFQRLLVNINGFFTELQTNQKKTDSLFKALDMTLTPTSHTVLKIWNSIVDVFYRTWDIVKTLFREVAGNNWVWAALGASAWIFASAIGVINDTMVIWHPILKVVIPMLIIYKSVATASAIATGLWNLSIETFNYLAKPFRFAILLINGELLTFITRTNLATVFMGKQARGADGRFRSLTRLEKAVRAVGRAWRWMAGIMAAADLAALANPYVLLAVLILAVAAAAVYMMVKWKQVNDFIKRHSWLQIILFFVSPLLFAMYEIRRHWDDIKAAAERLYNFFRPAIKFMVDGFKDLWHAVRTVAHWIKTAYDWLNRFFGLGASKKTQQQTGALMGGGWWNPINWGGMLANEVGMQTGGTVMRRGWAVVGERGPEMLRLPRGARVDPLPIGGAARAQPVNINLKAELKVDGRKMAETVARYATTVNARR